ncbi:OmpA family protein [Fulvivirga maritima]|uniref:OmpA family protein n=1 Tax=Fulvivirga maritima TaxID=2904247 RepID=UPI001F2014AB|nr:OmpA family protein [Fulvivirga maritima]UII26430.1 OmpA family protein [Fulvivirga maritima]
MKYHLFIEAERKVIKEAMLYPVGFFSMKKLLVLSLITLCVSLSAYAQSGGEMLKMAESNFEEGNYYDAIPLYEKYLQANRKDMQSWYHLAEALYASRNHSEAATAYGSLMKLINNDKELKNTYYLAYLHYGNSLMAVQQYEEAKKQYLDFLRLRPTEPNYRELKRIANAKIRACSEAQEMQKEAYVGDFKIEILPEPVNSPYSDFGLVWLDQSSLLYTSLPSDTLVMVQDDEDFAPVNQLYIAKKSNGSWQAPEPAYDFNHEFFHTANGSLSMDGKSFAFSICQENDAHEVRCAIYVSTKKHGQWSKPVKIKGGINKSAYTSTQPSFGEYTRRRMTSEVLYFVSDRPGGRGGLDIWYSAISRTGEWAEPVNCGSGINTSGNEVTPFYDKESGQLYFSSDYHYGMGGYDVFYAEGALKSWRRPENLGASINTGFDETYFSWRVSNANGTLVSNREADKSVFGKNCCDDIYFIEKQQVMELPAIVVNEDSVKLPEVNIALALHSYDNYDSIETSLLTGKEGDFKIRYKKDYSIEVAASKTGYDKSFKSLRTDDLPDTLMIVMRKAEEKEKIEHIDPTQPEQPLVLSDQVVKKAEIKKGSVLVLENIYFAFGDAEIQSEALKDLDVLERFLINNPKVKIEISGHTDSKGDDELNLKLSQDRANNIRDYLIEKGISSDRIVAVGYGETKPMAPNENPDGSDNEEGRRKNRRTEVVILED